MASAYVCEECPRTLVCAQCGSRFTAARTQKLCSQACRAKYFKATHSYQRKLTAEIACSECNQMFKPARLGTIMCSDTCRKRKARRAAIASGQRAANRKARKVRKRGVTVEAVNPLRVLERDRWTCQLCGVSAPKRLRGSYDDRAPEVDHIIPLARGGEHSYRNTQCACRRCNLAKSSQPMGQMRLFG